MLRLNNVYVSYGGLAALKGVSVQVDAGKFIAIIGPNGAGKTTLFKAISGVVPTSAGNIEFEDQCLTSIPAWKRAHFGISHVPEGRQVFRDLTVAENLLLGLEAMKGRKVPSNLDRVYELFPVLAERRQQLAGTLSGGEQQMLAIGRGLASAPRLLMLDEPSMGLAPVIADGIFDTIKKLNLSGLTILMVEQRAAEALTACDYGYVLSGGSIVANGPTVDLLANDEVRRAYLGA